MIEKLKKRIDFELVDCKFVERDKLMFLDIEIDSPKINELEIKSKIISNILDEIDTSDNNYYLNVYSSGIEKKIDINDMDNHLGKNIKIYLENQYLNNNLFEGELLEVSETSIKLKINMKGCFRKIEFPKHNIKELNESIKLTKSKKDKKNEKSNKPTRLN